jgi:hypothetical protein
MNISKEKKDGMSKQAGWTEKKRRLLLESKSSELLLQLHAQVWGGRLSRVTERSLERAGLKLAAGQGEGATYDTERYGTW